MTKKVGTSSTENGETTPDQHRGLAPPWQPGQSGNPAGRPKGSRNKLGEDFIRDLYADWTEHGPEVIEAVRHDKPDAYLKVIASILPKELNVHTDALGEMSEEEIVSALSAIRSFVLTAAGKPPAIGTRPKDARKPN